MLAARSVRVVEFDDELAEAYKTMTWTPWLMAPTQKFKKLTESSLTGAPDGQQTPARFDLPDLPTDLGSDLADQVPEVGHPAVKR